MWSMSVAGRTPCLKLFCWLGQDRECVSWTRPSLTVVGWRCGWRKSRNQSLPRTSNRAFCWLVRNKNMAEGSVHISSMHYRMWNAVSLVTDVTHSCPRRLSDMRISERDSNIWLRIQMRLAGSESWADETGFRQQLGSFMRHAMRCIWCGCVHTMYLVDPQKDHSHIGCFSHWCYREEGVCRPRRAQVWSNQNDRFKYRDMLKTAWYEFSVGVLGWTVPADVLRGEVSFEEGSDDISYDLNLLKTHARFRKFE